MFSLKKSIREMSTFGTGLLDCFPNPLNHFLFINFRYYIYIRFVMCFFLPAYINTVWLGEDWWISFITMDFIRYVANLNFTFLVNSAAHMYGYKPYDT
jgi:Fatty-acid desaturase